MDYLPEKAKRLCCALAIVAAALADWLMLTVVFFVWFGLTRNHAADPGLHASWWALLLMGCCSGFALTPMGEAVFRFLHGCRRPTPGEEARLRPLFEDVCRAARVSPDGYDLYLSNDRFPNAFAMGRRSVCLTRSLLDGFGDEAIRGVLAHEVGHHVHGDAVRGMIFYMITLVGQMVMWGGWLAAKILSLPGAIIGFGQGRRNGEDAEIFSVFASVVRALMWVFQIFVWIPIFAGACFGLRRNEYRADRYAAEIGYAEGLLSFLNRIRGVKDRPSGFMGLLYRTHPKTEDRIRRLEEWEKAGPSSGLAASGAPAETFRPWKLALGVFAGACLLALGWTTFAARGTPAVAFKRAARTVRPPAAAPGPKPKPKPKSKPVAAPPAAVSRAPKAASAKPAAPPKPRSFPGEAERAMYVNTGVRTDRSQGEGYYERWFDGRYGKGAFKAYLGAYYRNYRAGKEISANQGNTD
jgi:heat shock protein HtpX